MENAKEIQNRIKSIRDTMKITKAMYMMSSMKLRKALKRLEETEPFFYGLQDQIHDILLHFPDMQHLYFDNRDSDQLEEVKRKAYIVVTGDKGMSGSYNHNVIRAAREQILDKEADRVFVVGELGVHYFRKNGYRIEEDYLFPLSNPNMHRARVLTLAIKELYEEEKIDEVYIIYTKMINSISQKVEIDRLLPLKTHTFIEKELYERLQKERSKMTEEELENLEKEFLIYPSNEFVLEKLVYNYITGYLYGALAEAAACEESARMLAMQTATDNAQEMLRLLSVEYNRVRQGAITQEITEVVGGERALKKKKKKKETAEQSA